MWPAVCFGPSSAPPKPLRRFGVHTVPQDEVPGLGDAVHALALGGVRDPLAHVNTDRDESALHMMGTALCSAKASQLR